MNDTLPVLVSGPPELLIIGAFILTGWIAQKLGQYTHVPRVTILLLVGILAGPYVLDIIPVEAVMWFPIVTHFTLAMVGFLLGESFAGRELKQSGRTVLYVSIGETLGAALLVFIVVYLFQDNLFMALLLAGIAPASAPAATLDVIRESRAHGPLTRVVLGVVAIDDAWGVILFSILLVIAEASMGHGTVFTEIGNGLWDVIGAVLLGIACGIPMAWFTGRMSQGEPTRLEASGFVFICGGLAMYYDVSYLLACIVLGATVANRAKHFKRPFRDIENASEPFVVMFFLLAGYECNILALKTLGVLGLVYIIGRSAGLILGGGLAAKAIAAPAVIQSRVGWCLLPQAGIALGLALLVSERMPELGESILPLIIASTVVFEIFGPLITRWHLKQAHEIGHDHEKPK